MVEVCAVFCYFPCGYMPRDNGCMYMTHVCFYVCCSDCGNVCCVEAVVNNSGVFEPWNV